MTKYAKISEGTILGKTVSGVFKMHQALESLEFDDNGLLTMLVSNWDYKKPTPITFDLDNLEITSEGFKWGYSEEEVAQLIDERFGVFADMTEAMLDEDSGICSLVVTGATGVGKTYNLEKRLREAEAEFGQCYDIVGGKSTATGLYMALFRNRFPGQILVLDDCNVFDDENAVDILKNALDTSDERWVSNLTLSKDLKDSGVPQKFKFEGKVVFLSNINFIEQIQRNTKISPHLKAFIGRSTFLDLMIHDTRSILLHVENVVRKSTMFQDLGLTEANQEQALKFLKDNVQDLVKLSIRTPLEIGKIMRKYQNWERIARVTQLVPQQIIWSDEQ